MQKKWNSSLFNVHFAAQKHSGQKRTESKERLNRTFITITSILIISPHHIIQLQPSSLLQKENTGCGEILSVATNHAGGCQQVINILSNLKICISILEMRNTNAPNANFVWFWQFSHIGFWVFPGLLSEMWFRFSVRVLLRCHMLWKELNEMKLNGKKKSIKGNNAWGLRIKIQK